jgi:hypothetical protein
MEKYFYLFGGVIIGTFLSHYLKKDEDMDDDDMSDDDECIHSHVVNSPSIHSPSIHSPSIHSPSILCEPEVIKLKSM